MASAVVNVNEVLDGHVGLELDCLDRIYLNAYVPRLQTSGQVAVFMTDHLGLPSGRSSSRSVTGSATEVRAFAKEPDPVLGLASPDRRRWDDRKLDHVQGYLARAERREPAGVVAIVAAQELAWVWNAKENRTAGTGSTGCS